MSLTKKEFAALERVFANEIVGRLPFQSRAKIFRELCDSDLLAPMSKVIGGPPFPVTVSGYELTHKGRYLYCLQCAEDAE